RFLRDRGYHVHGWRLGRNLGPDAGTVAGLGERFAALRARHGRKLSIIGWSLGGIYARELARRFPADVRQVITLASPFRPPSAPRGAGSTGATATARTGAGDGKWRRVRSADGVSGPSKPARRDYSGVAAVLETPGPRRGAGDGSPCSVLPRGLRRTRHGLRKI